MATIAPPQAISSLRFTRTQFYEILDHLNPDVHYELLGGVILAKPRANPPHAGTVKFFSNRLTRGLDDATYQIQTQDGIEIDPDEAPEPDVCVLAASPDYYSTRHPNGGDAALVIEIGDTERNGRDKMRRYMQDGRIPLAWRIDIPERCVEIWVPAYAENPVTILRGDQTFAFEGVVFTADEIPALKP
jgi:Uma2 family endonuclease